VVVTQAEGLDPESLYTIRQCLFTLAQQEMQRYAGTIQRFVDNGFLAFFGAAVTQEDHAQRAVLVALRIREQFQVNRAELTLLSRYEPAVCMAVHTGEVIVGPIGADLRRIALAVGDTTQIVEHLLQLAEPGAILLSDTTGHLVRGTIRLEEIELRRGSGATRPQTAYKVLGRIAPPAILGWQGRRVRRVFVGREREMSTLQALLAQVENGAQGHGEEGVARMRPGIAPSERLMAPYFRALLAEAHTTIGQTEEGWAVLAEVIDEVNQGEGRFYAAELYRLKGELLLRQAMTNAQQAEACFQQALDLAPQSQAKWWELRAAMSLSRLWQHQGRCDAAHQLLAEVYGWFTEGSNTADLQDASSLLHELQYR
jgi:class 3 adenylate cyclase